MSSNSSESLNEIKSLVGKMIFMQVTEHLFLRAQQLLDSEATIEERVRRMEVLNNNMKWFNSERTRILEQLQLKISGQISVEHLNAMNMSENVFELREGLDGLSHIAWSLSDVDTYSGIAASELPSADPIGARYAGVGLYTLMCAGYSVDE
ncbi:GD12623 [Drosophila simulans]|uniref:GD12623 n=1 Tax=Drosophila simulans TaxID=7240 RepID=B4QJZ5_DROSI|nr:GD12623 [Drosophila simulans]